MHRIVVELDARCIETVYQTHVFARIATRFDCVEWVAALRAISRILSPGVGGAAGDYHDAIAGRRLN